MDNKKVLVVDDDPLIVEILKKGLEMAGVLVSTATSYAQVKDVLSKIIPDAILMDINIPGVDGISLCREIRFAPETSEVPIIMLTAFSDDKTYHDAMLFGATDYITKPFEMRDVVSKVTSSISKLKQKKDAKK